MKKKSTVMKQNTKLAKNMEKCDAEVDAVIKKHYGADSYVLLVRQEWEDDKTGDEGATQYSKIRNMGLGDLFEMAQFFKSKLAEVIEERYPIPGSKSSKDSVLDSAMDALFGGKN